MKKEDFDMNQFNGAMKAVISILVALILVIILFSLVAKAVWVIFKIVVPLLVIAAVAAGVWKFIEKR